MRTERFSTKIFVAALGVILAAALGAIVMTHATAEPNPDEETTYKFENSYLSKNVQAPVNATFAKQSFTFTFTGEGLPAIQPQTLKIQVTDGVIVEKESGLDYTEAQPAKNEQEGKRTTQTGYGYIVQKQMSTFMPQASEYGEPGEYTYTVVESAGASGEGWVHNSAASYTLRVYVIRNAAGNLEYKGATFEQTKDDQGATIEVPKKDPSKTQGNDNKTQPTQTTESTPKDTVYYDGFTFENVYKPVGDLTINKKITGEYARYDDEFQFTMTLANTDPSEAKSKYVGVIVNKAGQTVGYNEFTIDSGVSFTLKGDEKMVFDGTTQFVGTDGVTHKSDKLLAGVSYSCTETGVSTYEPSAEVATMKSTGSDKGTIAKKDAGSSLEIKYPTVSQAIVGQGTGNYSTVTNNRVQITPTGFLIDNAPYMLLIGIPIVAAICWLVIRRKRLNA